MTKVVRRPRKWDLPITQLHQWEREDRLAWEKVLSIFNGVGAQDPKGQTTPPVRPGCTY